MTAQTDRLNTALAGRYRIERHLGEGGMASVYLCEDLKHDRKVALKLLKPELAAVLGGERFVVEIKTTASLQHPHILPLFDSGSADGFLFYVMPYIEGETLRAKLSRETQLGIDESVRFAREVLDALDYAHQHGVIHRDIKPENILLHGGHAMVADFGIALAVSAAAGGRMTETGLSLGTPHYMSPEQATAEKEITARSDVYSLGSVLYEMLAGQPPHLGGSAQQVIMKIIAEPVPPVTTLRKAVPPNVAAAVGKALEKLPADRFESAHAFGEALSNPAYTHASGGLTGVTTGVGGGSARLFKRAFVGTALLAAAAIGTTLWGWNRPAPAAVSRQRIVLWDDQRIPRGRVARGVAISPNGETIVYMDSTTAGTQLFAKERDRLEAVPLTGTTGVVGAPTFSPDGAWIAFLANDGTVKKVPAGGGSAITIADSGSNSNPTIAWLDNGTILYSGHSFRLRSVGQDGGGSHDVFDLDSAGREVASVAGLPGGQSVLIGTCDYDCGTADLRTLDLRSHKGAVLAEGGLAGWPLPGGVVAFVRQDGVVLAGPFDRRTLAFTRPPTPVLDGIRVDFWADIAVSAGGAIVYVSGTAMAGSPVKVSPVWVTRTGSATVVDTAWTMEFGGTNGQAFSISPDGGRVAVTALRPSSGALQDVWIKQLDRGPYTRITFESSNSDPTWTAGGLAVVYPCGPPTKTRAVCRRSVDGTGREDTLILLHARGINDVVLTPDSARFVLRLTTPPSRDLVLARRGDTTITPLAASPNFDETTPALSPDGHWLAYASNESGRFEVYVRPFPTVNGGRWEVSDAGGSSPLWARSGRELFYRNQAKALVAVAVTTGESFRMGAQSVLFNTSEYVSDTTAFYYDVAPDGKRFLMLRPVGTPGTAGPAPLDKLVRVTNWAAEVQAKLAGKTLR